jgi:ComF family protein
MGTPSRWWQWLFEWRCSGCSKRQGARICQACLSTMVHPHVINARGMRVVAGGCFTGALRNCLFAFKYRGRRDLVPSLVGIMHAACTDSMTSQRVVVPVPLHPTRLRKRGFNQAALLARGVAKRLERPYLDCLRRTKDTRPQWRLSRHERLLNLDSALSVCKDLQGVDVLLVDDVLTTGATAEACWLALQAAGARSILVLVLASRPVSGQQFDSHA